MHCTFKTHVIFTKLARLIERGSMKAENVKKWGVGVLVFVLAAPPCGRKHRTPTNPGWDPIQGWADGVG